METLHESKTITKSGLYPYSIALNSTGNSITPFATHIKIYEKNKEPYFVSGDYCYTMEEAMESFLDRSKKINSWYEIA